MSSWERERERIGMLVLESSSPSHHNERITPYIPGSPGQWRVLNHPGHRR
jgi:hypothetical protein